MTRLPQLLLLSALVLTGCDRNETTTTDHARQADPQQTAMHGDGSTNDVSRTLNVQHNSSDLSGAGSPGVGTNAPATNQTK